MVSCYCTSEENYFLTDLYPYQKWILVFIGIVSPYELGFSWCELPFLVVLSPLIIATNLLALVIAGLNMFIITMREHFVNNVNFIVLKVVFKNAPKKIYYIFAFATVILVVGINSTLPIISLPSEYCYLVNVTDIHDTAPLKWQASVYGNSTCINGTKVNIVDYKSLESYNDQMLFVNLNCESGDAYVSQDNVQGDAKRIVADVVFMTSIVISSGMYFISLALFIIVFFITKRLYVDMLETQKKINILKPHGTYKLSLVSVV